MKYYEFAGWSRYSRRRHEIITYVLGQKCCIITFIPVIHINLMTISRVTPQDPQAKTVYDCDQLSKLQRLRYHSQAGSRNF